MADLLNFGHQRTVLWQTTCAALTVTNGSRNTGRARGPAGLRVRPGLKARRAFISHSVSQNGKSANGNSAILDPAGLWRVWQSLCCTTRSFSFIFRTPLVKRISSRMWRSFPSSSSTIRFVFVPQHVLRFLPSVFQCMLLRLNSSRKGNSDLKLIPAW